MSTSYLMQLSHRKCIKNVSCFHALSQKGIFIIYPKLPCFEADAYTVSKTPSGKV